MPVKTVEVKIEIPNRIRKGTIERLIREAINTATKQLPVDHKLYTAKVISVLVD